MAKFAINKNLMDKAFMMFFKSLGVLPKEFIDKLPKNLQEELKNILIKYPNISENYKPTKEQKKRFRDMFEKYGPQKVYTAMKNMAYDRKLDDDQQDILGEFVENDDISRSVGKVIVTELGEDPIDITTQLQEEQEEEPQPQPQLQQPQQQQPQQQFQPQLQQSILQPSEQQSQEEEKEEEQEEEEQQERERNLNYALKIAEQLKYLEGEKKELSDTIEQKERDGEFFDTEIVQFEKIDKITNDLKSQFSKLPVDTQLDVFPGLDRQALVNQKIQNDIDEMLRENPQLSSSSSIQKSILQPSQQRSILQPSQQPSQQQSILQPSQQPSQQQSILQPSEQQSFQEFKLHPFAQQYMLQSQSLRQQFEPSISEFILHPSAQRSILQPSEQHFKKITTTRLSPFEQFKFLQQLQNPQGEIQQQSILQIPQRVEKQKEYSILDFVYKVINDIDEYAKDTFDIINPNKFNFKEYSDKLEEILPNTDIPYKIQQKMIIANKLRDQKSLLKRLSVMDINKLDENDIESIDEYYNLIKQTKRRVLKYENDYLLNSKEISLLLQQLQNLQGEIQQLHNKIKSKNPNVVKRVLKAMETKEKKRINKGNKSNKAKDEKITTMLQQSQPNMTKSILNLSDSDSFISINNPNDIGSDFISKDAFDDLFNEQKSSNLLNDLNIVGIISDREVSMDTPNYSIDNINYYKVITAYKYYLQNNNLKNNIENLHEFEQDIISYINKNKKYDKKELAYESTLSDIVRIMNLKKNNYDKNKSGLLSDYTNYLMRNKKESAKK
jgi:hypothetical protein